MTSTGSERLPLRAALRGAAVGAAVAPVAAGAALLSSTAEAAKPVLAPGLALLHPLQDRMADWPGLVNVVLGSAANGLVIGAAFGAAAAVARPLARRRASVG